jgi:hypothetical protein
MNNQEIAYRHGVSKLKRGLVVVAIGALLTWFTYSSAASGDTPGGVYFVYFGAFLYGGWDVIMGLITMSVNSQN